MSLDAAIDDAAHVSGGKWASASRLARDLVDKTVVPLFGAGASFDCNIPTAEGLALRLYPIVRALPVADRPSPIGVVKKDLGKAADAVALGHGPRRVLDELQLTSPTHWPDPDKIPDTFNAYRVFARLAKERFSAEAVTFNYDCHFEAAFLREGFELTKTALSSPWPRVLTVVADAETNARLHRRGDFVLVKAHGCVQRLRTRLDESNTVEEEEAAVETMIVRWSQLLDWRRDDWARDFLSDRARRSVLFLIGFSGADPVIHASLRNILAEIPQHAKRSPRIRVIDINPRSLMLKMLVRAGSSTSVTVPTTVAVSRRTAPHSLASALLIILTEYVLAVLKPHADATRLIIPREPRARLAFAVVIAPSMQRWSLRFAAAPPAAFATATHLRRTKVEYVPLSSNPGIAVEALLNRQELLSFLSTRPKTVELDRADGFIVCGGSAYMPVGIRFDHVRRISTDELKMAIADLPHPNGLELFAVASDGSSLWSRNLQTGDVVELA